MNRNPFTPNFGQIPMYIAGRDQVLDEVGRSLEEDGSDPARTSLLVGARGTGKTALLSYFSEESLSKGWISVNVSCVKGMQEDIIQQIKLRAEEYVSKAGRVRLKGISLGSILSLQWDYGRAQGQNWRTTITKVLDELEKYGIGLLITIDEVSPALEEMIQVASVYQHLLRENRKISLLMAGLPSEVSSLLNDRSVSFLRRASLFVLGRIEDHDVEIVFKKTVEASDKKINPKALQEAVDAIQGYPYMLQLVGYRVWQQSEEQKTISEKAVVEGVHLAEKDFETRVLRATVSELSEGDSLFIQAMLEDDSVSEISAIEKRTGKGSGYISRYRARLIARGVIEPCGRGKVTFSLPGLREYLRRTWE